MFRNGLFQPPCPAGNRITGDESNHRGILGCPVKEVRAGINGEVGSMDCFTYL